MLTFQIKRQEDVERKPTANITAENVGGGEKPKPKVIAKSEKVGRNDPCPCGSGKKYKKCCGADE